METVIIMVMKKLMLVNYSTVSKLLKTLGENITVPDTECYLVIVQSIILSVMIDGNVTILNILPLLS